MKPIASVIIVGLYVIASSWLASSWLLHITSFDFKDWMLISIFTWVVANTLDDK